MPPPKFPFAFGWRPDLPDTRDRAYSVPLGILRALPPKVDLRPKCPPVVDQGSLGSCTGCAIASAHYFDQKKQGAVSPFQPSRLFIYYNERRMENTIPVDAGAYIRDGFKSIAKEGVCPETLWPYNISRFSSRPTAAAFTSARLNQALVYMRVQQTLGQLKGCIAAGYPFVFGFTVYDSFMSAAVAGNGMVPLPSSGESVQGGHAVMAVGYDDSKQRFIVQNSWGTGWGARGFFFMPYSYLTDNDLSDDFWTVRTVELTRNAIQPAAPGAPAPRGRRILGGGAAAAPPLPSCNKAAREATKAANRSGAPGAFKVSRAQARARAQHMMFCERQVWYTADAQAVDPPFDDDGRRRLAPLANFHWFEDVGCDVDEEDLANAGTFGGIVDAIHAAC